MYTAADNEKKNIMSFIILQKLPKGHDNNNTCGLWRAFVSNEFYTIWSFVSVSTIIILPPIIAVFFTSHKSRIGDCHVEPYYSGLLSFSDD